MKFLILLISLNSFAGGFFPVGKNGVPLPGSEKGYRLHEFSQQCEEAEGVPCYDIDVCPVDECSLVDEEIDGPERWSNPFNLQSCQPEEACKELIAQPNFCESGKVPFYRNMGAGYEAYCAFKLAPLKVKTGKKVLAQSPEKIAAKAEARRVEKELHETKRARKQAAKKELKDLDIDGMKTIADLKKAVKLIKELQEE